VAAPDELLFVYGTLREDVAHPMAAVLRRYASRIGTASFRGRLFDLGEYPGAVPSLDAADRVVGELYRIEPGREAALFSELDRYEDCDPDDPSAGEYVRVRARIEPEVGKPVEAWIYQYNRPTHRSSRIDSGDYCARLGAPRTKA
jgi:pyruvate carboxylase